MMRPLKKKEKLKNVWYKLRILIIKMLASINYIPKNQRQNQLADTMRGEKQT